VVVPQGHDVIPRRCRGGASCKDVIPRRPRGDASLLGRNSIVWWWCLIVCIRIVKFKSDEGLTPTKDEGTCLRRLSMFRKEVH